MELRLKIVLLCSSGIVAPRIIRSGLLRFTERLRAPFVAPRRGGSQMASKDGNLVATLRITQGGRLETWLLDLVEPRSEHLHTMEAHKTKSFAPLQN